MAASHLFAQLWRDVSHDNDDDRPGIMDCATSMGGNRTTDDLGEEGSSRYRQTVSAVLSAMARSVLHALINELCY